MLEIIKNRRSIRKYCRGQIPDTVIAELLECGNSAPSGKNRKPWVFKVIKDSEEIHKISKLTTYSRFLRNAPIMILVYGNFDDTYPKEKDLLSIGCCVQNILLAASCKGYGSCVIGELFGKKIDFIEPIEVFSAQLVCGICIGTKNDMNDD